MIQCIAQLPQENITQQIIFKAGFFGGIGWERELLLKRMWPWRKEKSLFWTQGLSKLGTERTWIIFIMNRWHIQYHLKSISLFQCQYAIINREQGHRALIWNCNNIYESFKIMLVNFLCILIEGNGKYSDVLHWFVYSVQSSCTCISAVLFWVSY